MVCTLKVIDHENDVKVFKTLVEPPAVTRSFMARFWTFWFHFYEKLFSFFVGLFVFFFFFFFVSFLSPFSWEFPGNWRAQEREKQNAPPSRHFSFSLLQTAQLNHGWQKKKIEVQLLFFFGSSVLHFYFSLGAVFMFISEVIYSIPYPYH